MLESWGCCSLVVIPTYILWLLVETCFCHCQCYRRGALGFEEQKRKAVTRAQTTLSLSLSRPGLRVLCRRSSICMAVEWGTTDDDDRDNEACKITDSIRQRKAGNEMKTYTLWWSFLKKASENISWVVDLTTGRGCIDPLGRKSSQAQCFLCHPWMMRHFPNSAVSK